MDDVQVDPAIRAAHAAEHLDRSAGQRVDRHRDDHFARHVVLTGIARGTSRRSTAS
jgi:hypothetical protein